VLILGVDPGLANCGWALLDSRDARVRDCGTVVTGCEDETGDMQRRAEEVLVAIRPRVSLADLVVIEWPSPGGFGRPTEGEAICPVCRTTKKSGNAKSAAQTNAIAGGVLGLVIASKKDHLTPVPITWRRALGCHRGSDVDLHKRLAAVYRRTAARLTKGALPHVLDSIGLALFGRLKAVNLLSQRTQ